MSSVNGRLQKVKCKRIPVTLFEAPTEVRWALALAVWALNGGDHNDRALVVLDGLLRTLHARP